MLKTNRNQGRAPPRRAVAIRHRSESALSALSVQALDYMAFLMVRAGESRSDALEHFRGSLDAVPATVGEGTEKSDKGTPDDLPGEVLSRWANLARYSYLGRPRPLPLTGRRSLSSLIRSIKRSADIEKAIATLISTESVRLEEGRYFLTSRALELWQSPLLQAQHNLRVVSGLLKTVEGNARGRPELRRFERISIADVSGKAYLELDAWHRERAVAFLEDVERDRVIHTQMNPVERATISQAVCVFFSDDRPLPPLSEDPKEAVR
jgi:hypothetical protein